MSPRTSHSVRNRVKKRGNKPLADAVVIRVGQFRASLDRFGRNQLAKELHVSRETIARWYHAGAVPLARLERVAQVLQCSPLDLNPSVAKVVTISSNYNI